VPELTEVETLRRDLAAKLVGQRVREVHVLWPGSLRWCSPQDFARYLEGQSADVLSRRGKYLIFGLQGGGALIFHLGMSGRLLLGAQGEEPGKHTRLILEFDGQRQLRFDDPRKFGRVCLVRDAEKVVGKLGPEPLGNEFSAEVLCSLLEGRSRRLKPLLLNQQFIAGLGNIYADEALFEAGLNPCMRACDLDKGEIARLCAAIKEVLERALHNRGTTLSDRSYGDAYGREGRNQEQLRVYGRAGQPCPRCGTAIQRITLEGRGAHFCPRCQRLKKEEKRG